MRCCLDLIGQDGPEQGPGHYDGDLTSPDTFRTHSEYIRMNFVHPKHARPPNALATHVSLCGKGDTFQGRAHAPMESVA